VSVEWAGAARTRSWAIRDATTGVFVGTIDAQLDLPVLARHQVNLAVAVSAGRRRTGLGARAVRLCTFLGAVPEGEEWTLLRYISAL